MPYSDEGTNYSNKKSRADVVAPEVVIDADKQPDRIVVWLEGIQEIRMQRAGDLLIVRKTALHPEDLQRVNAILIGKQNSDQERLRITDLRRNN